MGRSRCLGFRNGSDGDSSTRAEPISIDAAQKGVERYINASGNGNFEIGEIIIFSNHAYSQVIETDTGLGAMEVLVYSPFSSSVYPEYGPNMMRNLKYGLHGGSCIGLTIAKYLVEAHGGHIWAESEGIGLGVRITFTIPVFD